MLREQLEKRLQTLKSEFESGQKILADLEAKQFHLRDTLLRISGAIQVLEELMSSSDTNNGSESQFPGNEVQLSEEDIVSASKI